MNQPKISSVGHVSIFVTDIERQTAFYRDILGMQVTDEDPNMGIVFMSADPETEHHHLVLLRGRHTDSQARWLQHIGFRCDQMTSIASFYRRLVEAGTAIDMTIHHGNALAVYFADPEGNMCEVYWPTGLKARQPFALGIDLDRPPAEILQAIEEGVRMHGETGVVDLSALSASATSAVSQTRIDTSQRP